MNVRRCLLGVGALTLGLFVRPADAEAQQQAQILNNPAMVAQICSQFAKLTSPGSTESGQPAKIQLQLDNSPAHKNAKRAADTTAGKPADAASPHAEHSTDSASVRAVKDSAKKTPAANGTTIECPAPSKKTP